MVDEDDAPFLLREELERLVPFESSARSSFVGRLGDLLDCPDDLARIVYDQLITYATRRLVLTARWLRRPEDDPAAYTVRLRTFIRSQYRPPHSKVDSLVSLLQACVAASSRRPSDATRNALVKEARARGLRCYLCGCDLSHDGQDARRAPTVDHVWPSALGGASMPTNLRVSCKACNDAKNDSVGHADCAFPRLSTHVSQSDGSFSNALPWTFRFAIWSRAHFACTLCGASASEAGPLGVSRTERSDNWHLLNILTTCGRHRTPEFQFP